MSPRNELTRQMWNTTLHLTDSRLSHYKVTQYMRYTEWACNRQIYISYSIKPVGYQTVSIFYGRLNFTVPVTIRYDTIEVDSKTKYTA